MTKDIPNIEVIKKILAFMGKDESCIEYVKDRPGHDRRYAVDWSKTKEELGWEPQYVDLDKGLERTVKWFMDNQDWWKRVKSGVYQDYSKK